MLQRIGACISTELIHPTLGANDKAGASAYTLSDLSSDAQMIPSIPCHHRSPGLPADGRVIVKEIGNTWRLASPSSASVRLIYMESNTGRMNVCSHGAAAVFVVGISRITRSGGMPGRRRARTVLQRGFLCDYRCFSGTRLQHFLKHFSHANVQSTLLSL